MKKGTVPKIVLILIVFLIFLHVMSNLISREKPFDDSDLDIVRPTISYNENAFFLLEHIGNDIYDPQKIEGDTFCDLIRHHYKTMEDLNAARGGRVRRHYVPPFHSMYKDVFAGLVDGDYWDTEVAGAILEKNRVALDIFDTAVTLPHLQLPEVKDLGYHMPYLISWRDIAELNKIRANYLFKTGNEKEALDVALSTIRFGHMIQNADGPMLSCLNGVSIESIGLDAMINLVPKASLTQQQLREYVDRLAEFDDAGNGYAETLKVEYQLTKEFVEGVASGKYDISDFAGGPAKLIYRLNPARSFQLERTKELYARSYRISIKNLEKYYSGRLATPHPKLVPHHSPAVGRGLFQTFKYYASRNSLGKILHGILMPNLEGFETTLLHERTAVSATIILLALKCYKIEYGVLPGSLDQLVPEFLDQVPPDPFDGRPMRYSKERKIIYSVGRDLIDSGGDTESDNRYSNEPTFSIEN